MCPLFCLFYIIYHVIWSKKYYLCIDYCFVPSSKRYAHLYASITKTYPLNSQEFLKALLQIPQPLFSHLENLGHPIAGTLKDSVILYQNHFYIIHPSPKTISEIEYTCNYILHLFRIANSPLPIFNNHFNQVCIIFYLEW